MRGLYAIVDVETLERTHLDPIRFAEAILAARPAALQLRDKGGGARRTLSLLRAIAPLAARAGVPFFANDRPDLALLAGCDGVHVGQDDVPVPLVRSLVPARRPGSSWTGSALLVGLSTHDAVQVEAALEEGPDYLAVGPIFSTTSKDRPSPVVGLDRLAVLAGRVRAVRPGLPVVAIGGITLETAGAVGALVDAVAVIGALVPRTTPPDAASEGGATYALAFERASALHAAITRTRAGGAR